MTRIESAFYNKKAFIGFVTAGDPTLEMTKRLVIRMEEEGADLIELGIPFSDPVAEGPVIQAANERALRNGATTDKIFDMVAELRKSVSVPLVFLTYFNPIYTYGTKRFLSKCEECGVDGIIVPDLPYEERDEIALDCKKYGVSLISLIAPTSHKRIAMIAKKAEGFVYCVSSMGVTGVRSNIRTNLLEMVELVRANTQVPCAVGFGIGTEEHAEQMAEIADGAIVGSAIVELVGRYGEEAEEHVGRYVHQMKLAVKRAEHAIENLA